MSNLMGLELKIDEKYIAETAKKIIEAGVLSALGNKEELVSQVITSILSTKVNKEGDVSSYDSENRYTLLDIYVKNAVIETAKEVIREIVDENRTQLKRMFKEQLSSESSLELFVKSFVDNTVSSLEDTWRSRIEFHIDRPSE